MKRLTHLFATSFLLLPALALAAPSFPSLTGRVVDAAGVLSAGNERELDGLLAAHERKTGNQVVVATVPALQGYAIEDYGYQLGRAWGIGQKDRNNGALLIVAPTEHKLRIEVGYGLEGVLTDALTSDIVRNTVVPHLKQNDYDSGVRAGVDRMIAALEGDVAAQAVATPPSAADVPDWFSVVFFLFVFVFILLLTLFGRPRSRSGFNRVGGMGGFGGGGFGGGGGYRGGGGSFGGGGASGGW